MFSNISNVPRPMRRWEVDGEVWEWMKKWTGWNTIERPENWRVNFEIYWTHPNSRTISKPVANHLMISWILANAYKNAQWTDVICYMWLNVSTEQTHSTVTSNYSALQRIIRIFSSSFSSFLSLIPVKFRTIHRQICACAFICSPAFSHQCVWMCTFMKCSYANECVVLKAGGGRSKRA